MANNKIKESICSFEISKLLKEMGFDEMCRNEYIPSYIHNGEIIDEDEEFELKSEGRGDEIEIIEGGILIEQWNKNSTNQASEYSAPTLQMAIDWLEQTHKIYITTQVFYDNTNVLFGSFTSFFVGSAFVKTYGGKTYLNKHEAVEAAILDVLKKDLKL